MNFLRLIFGRKEPWVEFETLYSTPRLERLRIFMAENARAISMYQTAGFVEYGRNPKGFRSRNAGYQELIFMRLEL